MFSGQFFALLSAVLFGVSPVLCKLVIGDMSPALLAGLLYLGSGVGLQVVLLIQRKDSLRELKRLSPRHRLKLMGAIVSGGVIAPLCLAYGIKYGTASEVSLLLNFETVATTLIAWLIFKEYVGLRVWLGKILIMMAALMIILRTEGGLTFSLSGLLVILACIFWGIDNNLTRDVEELPATVLASIKGFSAGTFTTLLALIFSTGTPTPLQSLGALLIGAMSFGMSLVLFIEALRRIGSARTSTFFAIGPFVGTVLSVLVLGERPPMAYLFAASLMLGGIVLLYRERHGHVHTHEPLSHRHRHVHDEHHLHKHDNGEGKVLHDHYHVHEPLIHVHVHWPDIHHRHR
ncbi:MAG: EamA family transporter [Geobacteraceae bacterium]